MVENDNSEIMNPLLEVTEVGQGIFVPKAFALEWSQIEKTKLPGVSIIARPMEPIALQNSKFGGCSVYADRSTLSQ